MYFESIGTSLPSTACSDPTILQRETCLLESRNKCYRARPPKALERLQKSHKLTVPERLEAILDPGTPSFDLGMYIGDDATPQAGVYCLGGMVSGLNVIVIANDNTLHAGAWVAEAPEKIQRAQETARRLRLPIIWLIECPGLDLMTQEKNYGGSHGAGAIFEHQIRHAQAGLVQIAAVFGDCIAGGGYLPIFCDRVIMTEQATLCIGGTALNRFSKAGFGKLGGPDTHVHETGCADERVLDDYAACLRIRHWIGRLPTSAVPFYRVSEPIAPRFDIDDLYAILPSDPQKSFDIRELVARLADASLVSEIDADSTPTIFACHALMDGLPVIFIANQPLHFGSVLSKDSILKMTRIVQNAHVTGTPVIWLQDVSGFDIGETAERDGLLRHGAALLHALTRQDTDAPHLTICLRKAAGAGYYAMKGRPFAPALIAGTVLTRLEVMDPTILAQTLFDAKIHRSQAHIESLTAKQPLPAPNADALQTISSASEAPSTVENDLRLERAHLQALQAQKAALIEYQTQASDALSAARRGDIDTVLALHELRQFILFFVYSAWQSLRPRQPR